MLRLMAAPDDGHEERMAAAVAIGERVADIEGLANDVIAAVDASGHSPASQLAALDFLAAAEAVLRAGLDALERRR